jgi:hypothetical protein
LAEVFLRCELQRWDRPSPLGMMIDVFLRLPHLSFARLRRPGILMA